MQLRNLIASSLGFLIATTSAISVSVSYDQDYDDASRSLDDVSCSDGANGLITKGYSTQGSLPGFPMIGGAPTIDGWNSPNCGTCYTLTYNGNTIHILGIDSSLDGFNIALEAMNTLTNGQAVQLGRITADYEQVDASVCGL